MTEHYIRLRVLGYAPHRPTADGREFISYPYPEGVGYGVAVREAGGPPAPPLARGPGGGPGGGGGGGRGRGGRSSGFFGGAPPPPRGTDARGIDAPLSGAQSFVFNRLPIRPGSGPLRKYAISRRPRIGACDACDRRSE